MQATEQLMEEHEGIKLMLRVLEAVAAKVEKNESVPLADLDSIAEFLAVFADKCHHGKEEDHLFPMLEAACIPREGGPIGVMLAEHAQGRAYIAALKEAIAGLKAGKPEAASEFAATAGAYVGLLTQHIEKENKVLFRMAEHCLGEAKDAQLTAAFEKLERERIGPGRHEAFHALLDRLEHTYLG